MTRVKPQYQRGDLCSRHVCEALEPYCIRLCGPSIAVHIFLTDASGPIRIYIFYKQLEFFARFVAIQARVHQVVVFPNTY